MIPTAELLPKLALKQQESPLQRRTLSQEDNDVSPSNPTVFANNQPPCTGGGGSMTRHPFYDLLRDLPPELQRVQML